MGDEPIDTPEGKVLFPAGVQGFVVAGCLGRVVEGHIELNFFTELADTTDKPVVARVVMLPEVFHKVANMINDLDKSAILITPNLPATNPASDGSQEHDSG